MPSDAHAAPTVLTVKHHGPTGLKMNRVIVAYVICVAIANPIMWLLFETLTARDFGERGGVRIREALSKAQSEGKTPSSDEVRKLAGEIADQIQASTNWYRIALAVSVVQFTLIGALWAVVARGWLFVGLIPLSTLVWGNVLIQSPVRSALSWQQALLVFLVTQVVVCYAAAQLFTAIVRWVCVRAAHFRVSGGE